MSKAHVEEVTTVKDYSTPDLSTNDKNHDNISDITTKEIVTDDSTGGEVSEKTINSTDKEKKHQYMANSFAESITTECLPSNHLTSKCKRFALLRNLDNIDSDPREFSHVKKRLILATVALATSMYVLNSLL